MANADLSRALKHPNRVGAGMRRMKKKKVRRNKFTAALSKGY